MMFVFGEVADPLQESTLLVEDIVRSQVIEIVSFNFLTRVSTVTPTKKGYTLDYTSYSTS